MENNELCDGSGTKQTHMRIAIKLYLLSTTYFYSSSVFSLFKEKVVMGLIIKAFDVSE